MGEWRFNLNVFVASALDGEECSAARPGRFIYGQKFLVSIRLEAERDPEPVSGHWQDSNPNSSVV